MSTNRHKTRCRRRQIIAADTGAGQPKELATSMHDEEMIEPVRHVRDAVRAAHRAGRELVGRELDPTHELLPLVGQLAQLTSAGRVVVEQAGEATAVLKDHPGLAVDSEESPATPAKAVEWVRGDLVAAADHLVAASAAMMQASDAVARLYLDNSESDR